MERKSSINIKSCDETAALHNERVFAPDYLITESNIEVLDFDCNITKMKDKIINDYEATNRKGQYHKWQEKSVPIVEAVVNTKADTTMEELEQVKTMLMTEFGLDTMNISNHKDEGHFVITDDKTGYEYVVKRKDNKNFVRRDDGSSVSYKHTDEDGKGIEVYGKLKREYNHHAHFIINKYDFNTHKMVRLDKTDMIKMQTRVAEVLGMERGRFNSKAERLDHHKYTEIKTNENNNATLNLNGIELKIKDVKRFFKFNKKLAISLKNMEQADYTLLSQMQGQIGKKVKNKEYDSMTDFHKDLNKVIIGVLDKSERGITGSLKYDSEHRKKMVIALRKDFKKFMSNDTLDLENTLLIKKNKELKEENNRLLKRLKDENELYKIDLENIKKNNDIKLNNLSNKNQLNNSNKINNLELDLKEKENIIIKLNNDIDLKNKEIKNKVESIEIRDREIEKLENKISPKLKKNSQIRHM